MRRKGRAVLVAASAALCALVLGDSQPASARSESDAAPQTPCRPSQLRIADGVDMSPATGQRPLPLVFINRGAKVCVLDGYPSVAFLDAHERRLPFRISHKGDQMVTSRLPVAVRVAPGRSAVFLVNKYRCDRRNLRVAKKLRIGLPGPSARFTVVIPTYPVIAYCGPNDPGSVVTVSPIVPTLRVALAHGG
jgi:Protein of unknown function (DUF4232)